MRKHRDRGFTLVELLVVIAIVGVLVGLLLPAVQAARESARRATCNNHLKQLGLALQLYHDSHKSLPPGHLETGTSGPTYRHQFGWLAFILPFLEEENVKDRIDFRLTVGAPENLEIVGTEISVFICPSDPVFRVDPVWAPTNYLANQGIDCECRGRDCSGIFGHNTFTRLVHITDGLSNTIAIGETLKGDLNPATLADNHIFARRGGGVGADAQDIDTCQSLVPNASDRAARWLGGKPQHNMLNTSRAPNDPRFDCTAPNNGCTNYSARSAHPGGALIGMADGSVQFIVDTIEVDVMRALGTRAGVEVIDGGF